MLEAIADIDEGELADPAADWMEEAGFTDCQGSSHLTGLAGPFSHEWHERPGRGVCIR
jgi:hypothetical protein